MTSPERRAGAGGEFLVVGECVADIVRVAGRPAAVHPGGSPANVAYGLARLGHRVTLRTQLGDDELGRIIRAHLTGAGVRISNAGGGAGAGVSGGAGAGVRVRTPSATVTLDAEGQASYAFAIDWTLPPGPPPDPPPTHLHIGSIAATREPGASTVLDLVERLRAGATVSYDLNVRPQLLGGRAESVAAVERRVALSDVVKASEEDLDWLFPGEPAERVVDRWLAAGVPLVLLTRGARGALAATRAARVNAGPAPAPAVVDTVGAGDSFLCATLDALAHAGALSRAALPTLTAPALAAVTAHAARAAARTVARPGAHLPNRAELPPPHVPFGPGAPGRGGGGAATGGPGRVG
ncbi:carbohydrate kinase [Streptomyces sp. 3MP-14]|uniref:Carbohydrate kinase n=1 Tax=Streptomyces mimosae TaxID=2586635 RepID=A0A5N6AC27_9ACTN|nr:MULTISPECIES: carbohydrate kinase [Streptomyces]KAB8165805.1 carbohydrate kinase [Streptomyces mimosae]KAB8176194.1 carbohydrate kinase [Streptomyces sp. 3MP-14]